MPNQYAQAYQMLNFYGDGVFRGETRVDPTSIRRGDPIALISDYGGLPSRTPGTFIRIDPDAIGAEIEIGGVRSSAPYYLLYEPNALPSDLDVLSFQSGYAAGVEAAQEAMDRGESLEVGQYSQHQIPSDFSRAFVAGWRDWKRGVVRAGYEPYNEEVRRIERWRLAALRQIYAALKADEDTHFVSDDEAFELRFVVRADRRLLALFRFDRRWIQDAVTALIEPFHGQAFHGFRGSIIDLFGDDLPHDIASRELRDADIYFWRTTNHG